MSWWQKIERHVLPLIPTFTIIGLITAVAFLVTPIFSVRVRLILTSTTGVGSYYGACIAAIGVMLTALLVHRRSVDEFRLREQREKEFREEQILESRRINFANQRSEFSKQLSDTARQFGSKEPIVQASAVTGIMLQIDAWYQLEKLESDNIKWEKNRNKEDIIDGSSYSSEVVIKDYDTRLRMLIDESRRKRQELFYLAFRGNVDKPSLEFFLARCAGFKERISSESTLDSFSGLKIDGVEMGALHINNAAGETSITPADFSYTSFKPCISIGGNFSKANFSHSIMREIHFGVINLDEADFSGADISFSDLRGINLSSSIIDDSTIFYNSIYDSHTSFPVGFDPNSRGMRYCNEQ